MDYELRWTQRFRDLGSILGLDDHCLLHHLTGETDKGAHRSRERTYRESSRGYLKRIDFVRIDMFYDLDATKSATT